MTLWTSETPPRKVEIKGRSAMDPDCTVVQVDGRKEVDWMYPTGYIGRNIFAAKTPTEAKKSRDQFAGGGPT